MCTPKMLSGIFITCTLSIPGAAQWSASPANDTRAMERSGGLTHVPCDANLRPDGKDFCVYLNGYHWKTLSKSEQIAFIATYNLGVSVALRRVILNAKDPDSIRDLGSRLTPMARLNGDETIASVDMFYATPENLGVPIPYGLQLIAEKVAGASDATMQERADLARQLAATKWVKAPITTGK